VEVPLRHVGETLYVLVQDVDERSQLGVELGFLYSGPWDDDVDEMRIMLAGVKEHPSWRIFHDRLQEDEMRGPEADVDDGEYAGADFLTS